MRSKGISRMYIVAIAMICVIVIAGTAYYLYTLPPAKPNVVRIGHIDGITPPGLYQYSRDNVAALRMLADKINSAGGVLGSQIEFLFEDDQGSAEKFIAAFEKLKTTDVKAWMGSSLSTVVVGSWDKIADDGRPWFPYVWSDQLRLNRMDNSFFVLPFGSLWGQRYAEAVIAQGFKDVVCICSNGVGEIDLWNAMKKYMTAANVTVHKEYILDRETKDFTQYLFEIKSTVPKIDLFINSWGVPPEDWTLTNQASEMGLCGPGTGTPWIALAAGGVEAEVATFWNALGENGLYSMSMLGFHPKIKLTPIGQELVTEFILKYNRDVSSGVFAAWDSLISLTEAWKIAGTFDPEATIDVLQTHTFNGTRFNMAYPPAPANDKTTLWHQNLDVPFYLVQLQTMNAKRSDSPILWPVATATGTLKLPTT